MGMRAGAFSWWVKGEKEEIRSKGGSDCDLRLRLDGLLGHAKQGLEGQVLPARRGPQQGDLGPELYDLQLGAVVRVRVRVRA